MELQQSDGKSNGKEYESLIEALATLKTKLCTGVKRSYGGGYNIDFDTESASSSDSMGSIYLMTQGTNFVVGNGSAIQIDTRDEDVEDASTIERINQIFNGLIDTTVTAADVEDDTFALTVHVSSGVYIKVVPTDEDDEYDLPYWSIVLDGINRIDVGANKNIKFNADKDT